MMFSYNDVDISESTKREFDEIIKHYRKELEKVTYQKVYEEPESFLNSPFDSSILATVRHLVKDKCTSNLRKVLLVGMGGSTLGAQAVYKAVETRRGPELVVFESTDPSSVVPLAEGVFSDCKRPDEYVVVVVSKSGTTIETLVLVDYLFELALKKFGDPRDRFVVVTEEKSKLEQETKARGIRVCAIPRAISGRFSVFSAAGLVPLVFLGVDCEALLRGARKGRDASLLSGESVATLSAESIANASQERRSVYDIFIENDHLYGFGAWYRQLVAETLGKREGIVVPTVSKAPQDLHSVLQMYLNGKGERLTLFLTTEQQSTPPLTQFWHNVVPELKGKTLGGVHNIIWRETIRSYSERKFSYMEQGVAMCAEDMGELLMTNMISVLYAAKLLDVAPFTQSEVDQYKKELHTLLS